MKNLVILILSVLAFSIFSQSIDSSYVYKKNAAYLEITTKTPIDTITRGYSTMVYFNTTVEFIGLFTGDTLILEQLNEDQMKSLSKGDTIEITTFYAAGPLKIQNFFVRNKKLTELEPGNRNIQLFAMLAGSLIFGATLGAVISLFIKNNKKRKLIVSQ